MIETTTPAGHVEDSASVFAARIRRIQMEQDPILADFVTDDPLRLARYAGLDTHELVLELERAQDELESALAAVEATELDRPATHKVDGPLVLLDLVTFLPAHQRDHADQLDRLVTPPAAR